MIEEETLSFSHMGNLSLLLSHFLDVIYAFTDRNAS